MKLIFKCLIVLFLLNFSNLNAIEKLAIIDIENVIQNSPQKSIVFDKLELEFKDYIKEIQNLEQKLKIEINKLQKDRSIMSEEDIEKLELSINAQKIKLSNKIQNFEERINIRQIEEKNKILNTIHKVIKKICIDKKLNIILDSKSIIYGRGVENITGEVITGLY